MANKLDELKQKYQSVFRSIEQEHVRLQNVNMQGDKLYIRGEAPSEEAKNRVWDQIKMVDPSYKDLSCDITVSAQAQPAAAQPGGGQRTMSAGAGGAAQEQQEIYTVQAGDSLSKIAERYYGDAGEYMKIFNANRDKIKDPNMIRPGQQLVIPTEES